MIETQTLKGARMDYNEPGWWAVVLAALGGFIGFRVAAAKDAVRIETMQSEQTAIKERLRSLENGSISTATTLATLAAQMEGISRTLTRMEGKIDGKADK